MNAQDFCYWLNGFVELNKGQMPDAAQWKSIQEHLQLVFTKVTPPVDIAPPLTLPLSPNPPPFGPSYPWWDPMNPNRITCQVDGVTLDLKSMTYC